MIVGVLRRNLAVFGAAFVGVGLLAGSAPALAGSAVTPTLVQLDTPRQTGEVTLYNGGSKPMLVEASVVSWTQAEGRDNHAPSQDILVAPAIIEIQPGSGQIFRVRPRAETRGVERAYRLRLEDITPAPPGGGVGMRVRHDLPLIVGVPGGKPDLRAAPCPSGAAGCVRVSNAGTAMARITGLTVSGSAGSKALESVATILAASWREWTWPEAATGRPLKITVATSRGPVTLPVARP